MFVQHADDQVVDLNSAVFNNAIESYQGAKTVEIWKDGAIWMAEALIETRKTIALTGITNNQLVTLVFRLRADWNSPYYIDVTQYVQFVRHSATGNKGA